MKRFLFFCMAMALGAALYAQTGQDRLTVVVTDEGGLIGRYVRQTDSTYVANPLDWEVAVPKRGHRVEVWTPEGGKGHIGRKEHVKGNINVRQGPSTKTPVVATITEADGQKDLPYCFFDCLGKSGRWYKVRVKGKVGYVRDDLVSWAAYLAD